MNPYVMLGSFFATNGATALSARLSAWHDAMVAHERRLRARGTGDSCDDECPHAEARALWSEAVGTFGSRAHELTFLRSRANASVRQSHPGAAVRDPMSEAADPGRGSRRTREPQARTAIAASSGATRRTVEL
jgi:hypothetical protein